MSDYQFVTCETLDKGRTARVMVNRPETRNAQHGPLLKDLDSALMRAALSIR